MPCILTTIYVLTFQKPSTMHRPSHPSIESNPRISTTEHVHALYFLYSNNKSCKKKSLKRCHSIGWKRSCDNQKFNRKENFTKSPRAFQTATVLNLLTRQQSSKYYYQVCESNNSISCLKFHIEKKCWGIINLDNHSSIKPGTFLVF
jgi:hypothetical protein